MPPWIGFIRRAWDLPGCPSVVVMTGNMTVTIDVVLVIMTTNGWRRLAGMWGAGGMMLMAWMGVSGGSLARAADWPVYRGVNHDGISVESAWSSDWGEAGPTVLWRGAVGTGYSSFVVSEGRAYTMGNSGQKEQETDTVFCFDAISGKVLWKHSYPCMLQPLYYEGGTLSTPTVDGDALYTLSKAGDLFCLDAATGAVRWQVRVHRDLGFQLPTWSLSSAPLVLGEKLILNLGSAGVAFDKKTGKVIWDNGKDVCGYATPVPCEIDGEKCVVLGAAEDVIGVRVADGKVLWRHPFTNKHKATAADPLIRGNEVFASSGYGRGCIKIRIDGGRTTLVFDNKVMSNLMSCSVLWKDQVYGFDEYALKCIDFADSREHWRQQGFGKGSLMMSADGRLIVMSDKGELLVARATPEKLDVMARAQVLPKGMCRTVPVLANGLIYVRNARGDVACLDVRGDAARDACRVVADPRVEEPLAVLVEEYGRLTGSTLSVKYLPSAGIGALVGEKESVADVLVCMPEDLETGTPVSSLPGATAVAWKHPGRLPVWVAAIGAHPGAAKFAKFAGGPEGHQIWANAKAGFTMVTGENAAEAFDWVAQNRVRHTYPLTAMRMLRELGGIREGVCIDIGCGPGMLAVELAQRSEFKIIGLDIDPDQKPLFERRIQEAGLDGRVSFVLGDAQQLPFPDNSADAIVSRGTLTFIPDIGKCLREVDRVLKPGGVAFLGGRYLYTSAEHKITTEALRQIVAGTKLPNAKVVDDRGQWVKIVGPGAPEAARKPSGGPGMLAHRFVADYGVEGGECLMIFGGGHGEGQQATIEGFLDLTDVKITAVYAKEEGVAQAEAWVREAKLGERVTCKAGGIEALPVDEGSFDVVVGVGPMLIFADRPKAMKEVFSVLRDGGVAMVGGQFRGMPASRKVTSETLRADAAGTGIPSIRIIDDMGQWVEIRKGVKER